MRHSGNHSAPDGVQTRLTAPGGRTRATGTRATTVHRQITPGHSPVIQPTSGATH